MQTVFTILRTARSFGNAVPAVKRRDLQLPPAGPKKESPMHDAQQTGQIITRAKEPFATMFAVLGMAGLRANEMLGLKVSDLDFSRKLIHILRSLAAC